MASYTITRGFRDNDGRIFGGTGQHYDREIVTRKRRDAAVFQLWRMAYESLAAFAMLDSRWAWQAWRASDAAISPDCEGVTLLLPYGRFVRFERNA